MSVAEFKTPIDVQTPANMSSPSELIELKPKITVIGVGGAGGNAVNNMIRSKLQGVQFIVCNTDSQSLMQSLADRRIQLGDEVTQGLGAGSRPETGRAAAEESMDRLLKEISGSNMVFITAGMGGGTGTGAAPVVAQAARERGILTVAVVTKPFHFEGQHRMKTAEEGIRELSKHVDTLIIIPNQNLFRVANEKTTFADAFKMADDVLHSGVRGVTDLMMMPGLINLDFADIRAIMSEMGKAMMGTGEAEGDGRALMAAEAAISNPLLDDVSMKGAQGVLINITGGYDMTLFEVDEAANRIREEVDPDANIIFGSTFDEKMVGLIRVSVVATGIESDAAKTRIQRYRLDREAAAQVQENVDQDIQTDEINDDVDADNIQSGTRHHTGVHSASTHMNSTTDYPSHDSAANGDRQSYPLGEHRYEEFENSETDNYQRYMSQETARPVKRGFFSRLAETMRGGLGREERLDPRTVEQTRRFQEEVTRFNTDSTDTAPVVDQKVQDVPAYLRRNKKN